MCGINGIFAYNVAASMPDRRELIATRDSMRHRGPDGLGEWWSADRRLGLGHRRLAFLDLSEAGAQPMTSSCGRYVVTFNGEIYNYPELRAELERDGVQFRSQCDTEALLVLYARHGEAMMQRLRGMFAFAIWDTVESSLFLARDPYGIKPLYVSDDGWTFRFASQVCALLAGGAISRAPEPAGIVGFHIWGSVPEPFTLFRDIMALPAGSTLRVSARGRGITAPYTSVARTFRKGTNAPASYDALPQLIAQSIGESVKAHLMADVEVGLFLSGGVDSGALLGLMADAGVHRPKAITLAFEEFRGTHEDESMPAGELARHYGAEHIIRTVTQREFETELPHVIEAMDQPSIDGVNSWFVSKATREAGLKAALSGLGGDELLAGYGTFQQIPRWVSWLRLPGMVPGLGLCTRVMARGVGLSAISPKAPALLEYGGSYAGAYLLKRGLYLPHELRDLMAPDMVHQGLERLNLAGMLDEADPGPCDPISRVAAMESSLYLRNQLLRDADWAGMAHSIEIRTPLVDSTLLKAISPAVPHLSRPGTGKVALAQAPRAPLPDSITFRKKTGFAVPTGHWSAKANAQTRGSKGQASRVWSKQVFDHFGELTRPPVAAA